MSKPKRRVQRPYPGLRPFEQREAKIFFGREVHIDRLLEILQAQRFLAVIGPSGSGKSSLVRAGLLPGLAMGGLGNGSDWRIAVMRPGSQPMLSLARTLLASNVLGPQLLPAGQTDATPADELAAEAELRRGSLGLLHLVRSARQSVDAATQPFNLLVLVDQFEEIFTYAQAGGAQADESDAFVNLLLAAKDDTQARIYVALTMRTDFLGNCVRFLDLPEAINRAQYLTPRLKRHELEAAITGPAAVFGGEIEPSLVAELINATGQQNDQLPLVQHALVRMWGKALELQPDAPFIDWAVAKEVGVHHGNVLGALNEHAENLLKNELSVGQQSLAEGLFRAITERRQASEGGQDVRRPLKLGLIAQALGCAWAELEPAVQCFAADDVRFLQHGAVLNADSVIDLSHEALIRQWGRLRDWVDDEAQRAAGFWRWRERAQDQAKHPSAILSAVDLDRALAWAGGHGDARWTPTSAWAQRYGGQAQDIGLIKQCIQASHTALRRVAVEKERHARDLETALDTAKKALREAALRRMAADATFMMLGERSGGDLTAIRLALAADAISQHVEVMSTLQRLFFGGFAPWSLAVEIPGRIFSVACSPDDKYIALGCEGGVLRQVDGGTGEIISVSRIERPGVFGCIAYSKNGLHIISGQGDYEQASLNFGDRDCLLCIWSVETGKLVDQPWVGHRKPIVGVFYGDGDSKVFSIDQGGVLLIWDAGTGVIIKRFVINVDFCIQSVDFFLNERKIFISGGKRSFAGYGFCVVDVDDLSVRLLPDVSGYFVVAFSPDGLYLALAERSSFHGKPKMRVICIDSWVAVRSHFDGAENGIDKVFFSPDAKFVFGVCNDGVIRCWRLEADCERLVSTMAMRCYSIIDAKFSNFGRYFLSVDDGRVLRFWGGDSGAEWIGFLKDCDEVKMLPEESVLSPNGEFNLFKSRHGVLSQKKLNEDIHVGEDMAGHRGGVTSFSYSSTGVYIVSGGGDGVLRVWWSKTGRLKDDSMGGHRSAITRVIFSSDDKFIVSGDARGFVRFWDVGTCRPIGMEVRVINNAVHKLIFSPDGEMIAVGGIDKGCQLIPAPAAWSSILSSKLTRNFSHKEWRRYVGDEKDFPYKEQCPGLPIPADDDTP